MFITNNDNDWDVEVSAADGSVEIARHKKWENLYRKKIHDFVEYVGHIMLNEKVHTQPEINGIFCVERGNEKKYVDRFFKENRNIHSVTEISKFEYMSYMLEGGIDLGKLQNY